MTQAEVRIIENGQQQELYTISTPGDPDCPDHKLEIENAFSSGIIFFKHLPGTIGVVLMTSDSNRVRCISPEEAKVFIDRHNPLSKIEVVHYGETIPGNVTYLEPEVL